MLHRLLLSNLLDFKPSSRVLSLRKGRRELSIRRQKIRVEWAPFNIQKVIPMKAITASPNKLIPLFVIIIFLVTMPFASAKPQRKATAPNQEKPEAILAAAKKLSENRAWRDEARIETDKQMNL